MAYHRNESWRIPNPADAPRLPREATLMYMMGASDSICEVCDEIVQAEQDCENGCDPDAVPTDRFTRTGLEGTGLPPVGATIVVDGITSKISQVGVVHRGGSPTPTVRLADGRTVEGMRALHLEPF